MTLYFFIFFFFFKNKSHNRKKQATGHSLKTMQYLNFCKMLQLSMINRLFLSAGEITTCSSKCGWLYESSSDVGGAAPLKYRRHHISNVIAAQVEAFG